MEPRCVCSAALLFESSAIYDQYLVGESYSTSLRLSLRNESHLFAEFCFSFRWSRAVFAVRLFELVETSKVLYAELPQVLVHPEAP
jgi:hypothetical protein